MALVIRALVLSGSVPYLANTPPCNFHRYATPDAVATVIAAGYFNGARDKLSVNDQIDAVCLVSGVADRISMSVTAVPASGNVTTAINTDASAA